jgi:hypothetical protein
MKCPKLFKQVNVGRDLGIFARQPNGLLFKWHGFGIVCCMGFGPSAWTIRKSNILRVPFIITTSLQTINISLGGIDGKKFIWRCSGEVMKTSL